jgi:hypothetical protein
LPKVGIQTFGVGVPKLGKLGAERPKFGGFDTVSSVSLEVGAILTLPLIQVVEQNDRSGVHVYPIITISVHWKLYFGIMRYLGLSMYASDF